MAGAGASVHDQSGRFLVVTLFLLAAGCGSSVDVSLPPLPSPTPSPSVPPPPGASDFANRDFAWPLSLADAEQILVRTEVMGFNWPNRQTQAYNTILDQRDAVARFRSIAGRARWAGRLYALCGLRARDPAAARELAATLAPVADRLWVYDSDQVEERSVGEVVVLIETRRVWVDLRGRKKEVNDYFRRSR